MNTKRICTAVIGLGVLLVAPVLTAQVDPSQGSGSGMTPPSGQSGTPGLIATQPTTMRDSLGAPGQTGQEMLDKQFVRTAAEGGLADVKLGTLATEKGSPAVKELAQKMVDDHMSMNKEMATVADSMGVMLPKKMNKDQQKEYDKLNGLSGKDFDTEYVTYTLKMHFDDLHAFHMEASVTGNEQLAAQVVKDMGMMHQHIGLIVNVAKDEGITLPPRPPRPAPATTASK